VVEEKEVAHAAGEVRRGARLLGARCWGRSLRAMEEHEGSISPTEELEGHAPTGT